MAKYKVQINGIKTNDLMVLSSREMNDLFILYQSGDLKAKDKLVEGNLKLVLALVQRFAHRCDNMDDLFQVGCIGLLKAIDNFDLKHEVRFSTYAVPMIVGEMKRYLRDNQMLKVSRSLKDLGYKLFFLKETYMQKYQKEADITYLANELKVKEKDVIDALDASQSVMSMFEIMYQSDGDELYLIDQIKDEKEESKHLADYISLKESLKTLPLKEQSIIYKRYYQDMTQSEIAAELDISQAQVSRLEKSALASLRKKIETK